MIPFSLDNLRVARPCSADWRAMTGTDRVRHCADCNLNVYNLSALSTAEARALVEETEGRRCVRFYRRADGTVLTRDCPGEPVEFARERLNGVLLALAFLGLWAVTAPLTDAAWTLANRGLESAQHALGFGIADDGGWIAGEMVPVDGMPPPPPPPEWQ